MPEPISGKRHGTMTTGLAQSSSSPPPPQALGSGPPLKSHGEGDIPKRIGLLVGRRKDSYIARISERQPDVSATLTYNP